MRNFIFSILLFCCVGVSEALAQKLRAEIGLETSVQAKFFPIKSSVQMGPNLRLGIEGKVASLLLSSSLYSYRGLSDAFSSATRFSNSLEVRCVLEERRKSYVHVLFGRNRNTFISASKNEPELQLASEEIFWAHTIIGVGYGFEIVPSLRLSACFTKEVANAEQRKSECSYFSFGLGYNVGRLLHSKGESIEP